MNDTSGAASMMMLQLPSDQETLAIVGEITLLHSHLDFILKMTVKSVADVDIQEALDATQWESSSSLRRRIQKLAKQKIGDGQAYIKLQALLVRCKALTVRRNALIHNVWAHELDGAPKIRSENHEWEEIPSNAELRSLAVELKNVTGELNHARLQGFLYLALKGKR